MEERPQLLLPIWIGAAGLPYGVYSSMLSASPNSEENPEIPMTRSQLRPTDSS